MRNPLYRAVITSGWSAHLFVCPKGPIDAFVVAAVAKAEELDLAICSAEKADSVSACPADVAGKGVIMEK